MKKITSYFLLVALIVAIGSLQRINAQTFYKVHHINEAFNNLGGTTLPTGWATTASTAALFARSGGTNTDNAMLRQAGAGSGNRGMDISFPSPSIVDTVSNVWYVEFDWKCEKVVMGPKNAYGMVLSGSTNNVNLRAANWYVASVFGLYLTGDGYFHYWNQDLAGPYQSDSAARVSNYYYYDHMGPVFRGGNSDGAYSRNGVSATHSVDSVVKWNEPTKTNVKFITDSISTVSVNVYGPRYHASKTYHITAKLNFATQRVESLTITQSDSTANSQTINNMPFLAPSMHGNDTTIVARENRIVKDLKFISQFNTRTSTAGSGPNVDFLTYVDNFEIYYLKQSVGTTDVTVLYKDKDGNTAKTSRVAASQQYNETFRLSDSDKESFSADGNYYAYDATATHEANADSEDGESIVISPEKNTITVVFKKFASVAGPLVWTGYEGPYLNQTDGNFKFGETYSLGYQNGVAMEFSDPSAPKDIILDGTIDLGSSDLTVSTTGYSFSGNGKATDKITGSGKFIVNAPATLNMINTTNVVVNTLDGVTIQNANCADTIIAVNNALIKLQPSATISKKIAGAGEGSSINLELLTSVKGIEYNFGIVNASVVNYKLKNAGRQEGSSWTSRMLATYPDGVQLNVTNEIEDKDTLAGFSGITSNLANVKVHLGDSVRLVRNYNESNGEKVTIGEISGTEKSIIEAGYVSGRSQTYAVGNLNTDAVFEGAIRQFLMSNGTFRTGTTLYLNKIGTGKWTLKGKLSFNGDIEVKGGTLEILGEVTDSVKTITVDSISILNTGAVNINSSNVKVNQKGVLNSNGTAFIGDVQVSGTIHGAASMYNLGVIDGAINLKIDNFDEGGFEKITSASDITMIRSNIYLTIGSAKEGSIIKIMDAGSGAVSYPEGFDGSRVFVNGVDITDNTQETEGAQFVYFAESGELMSLVNYTDVHNVLNSKEVKSIEYFNILGNSVDKYTKGLIIRRVTFTDNSTNVEKIFLPK